MIPKPHMRSAVLSAVLILASVIAIAEKIPDSAWQMGTLRSVTSDTRSRVLGAMNNGQGVIGEQVRIITHYAIDTAQFIYQADNTTRRHDKPLDVTINGPIKFAVMGTDIYVCEDTGKVHKMVVATKTLKTDNNPK